MTLNAVNVISVRHLEYARTPHIEVNSTLYYPLLDKSALCGTPTINKFSDDYTRLKFTASQAADDMTRQ